MNHQTDGTTKVVAALGKRLEDLRNQVGEVMILADRLVGPTPEFAGEKGNPSAMTSSVVDTLWGYYEDLAALSRKLSESLDRINGSF